MKIALVSDSHLSPDEPRITDNWSAVHRWLDQIEPNLVVHLGDLTANGYGDKAQLTFARSTLNSAHDKMLFLPGNHDIGDGPLGDGSLPREKLDPERLVRYRELFGPDWWSFSAESWLIVGLNAQLMGTGSRDESCQLAWLSDKIETHSGPVGLLLHKPMLVIGHNAEEALKRCPTAEARDQLLALLDAVDLRFIVAGHTHQYLLRRQNGIDHIWAPSTSYYFPDKMHESVGEKCVGTMLLELEGTSHRFTLSTPDNMVRHNYFDIRYRQKAKRTVRDK